MQTGKKKPCMVEEDMRWTSPRLSDLFFEQHITSKAFNKTIPL
jgi:hypothetical protein